MQGGGGVAERESGLSLQVTVLVTQWPLMAECILCVSVYLVSYRVFCINDSVCCRSRCFC